MVPSRYDVRTQGGREKSSAHILRTEEGRCQKKIAYFIYGWILIGSAKICGNGGKISKSNCGVEVISRIRSKILLFNAPVKIQQIFRIARKIVWFGLWCIVNKSEFEPINTRL